MTSKVKSPITCVTDKAGLAAISLVEGESYFRTKLTCAIQKGTQASGQEKSVRHLGPAVPEANVGPGFGVT